jgi:hypothetical protein
LAAARSADPFDLGEDGREECESREGRERSVVEVLNVWANQPDRRVGRSLMRVVEVEE